MRQKSHYSSAETVLNLYTFGQEWQLDTDEEYIGAYHQYVSTNEVYTGASWNERTSKRLIPYFKYAPDVSVYKKLNPKLFTNYSTFSSVSTVINVPTADSINRYFLKKVNDTSIYEVNVATYNRWVQKDIDPNLYIGAVLVWYIKGNLSSTYKNGIIDYGVIEKNKQQLQKLEPTMPGIISKLTNLTEYYVDTDVVTPKDINR